MSVRICLSHPFPLADTPTPCPGRKASGGWAALTGDAALAGDERVGEGGQDGCTSEAWPPGRGWGAAKSI